MSSPSSFEIGRATGNAVARGYQGYKDRSAIDEILEQANASGKPEDVDYAMTQILSRVSPEKQQLALAILQKKKADIQAKREREQQKAAYKAQGIPEHIADLPEDQQKDYFKQIVEQKKRTSKEQSYKEAGLPTAYAGLDPTTQRTMIQQKGYSDFLNQFGMSQSGQPSVGVQAQEGQPMPIVDENMDVAAQLEQERPQGAPLNMGAMLNKVSPVQQQAQPMQRPMPGAAQPQMQGQPQGLQALPDDQLVLASGLPNPMGQAAKMELQRRQEDRKIKQKEKESTIKRHTDISQKAIEKAESIAETLPQKRAAHRLMNDSIARKDMSFWSRDNLAEKTGIEGFRSSEGAIFKTAGKEYFLGSITRAGARPNQWIEQQISDMMMKIGRSTEANLSVSRALENELDLDEQRVKLTREIADQLENKLGYVPRDLGKRVDDQLKDYAEKRQKELYNDLRAIKAIGENKAETFMKVEPGTPVSKLVAKALLKKNKNDPKKAAEEAKQLGYSF